MPLAKDPKNQYLKPRNGSYYINVPIPTELRHHYLTSNEKEKTHIVQSLGTSDPKEAFRRKLPALQRILADFDLKRLTDVGSGDADLRQAIQIRTTYLEAKSQTRGPAIRRPDAEYAPTKAAILELVAEEEADEIDRQGGRTDKSWATAQTYFRVATGSETLVEAFDAWLANGELPPRTRSKYRTALDEFLAFLGPGHHLIPAMNRENAIAYTDWLNREGRSQRDKRMIPLSMNTKRDRVMALSAFWQQGLSMRGKTKATSNPWSHMHITERPTASDIKWDSMENVGRPKRRPYFDDQDLQAILRAEGPSDSHRTTYTKRTLMEVFVLALMTGARSDEVCSLHLKHIKHRDGVYWLHFTEGKNDESERTIPVVHPVAVGILARRIGDRTEGTEQLFAEFRPKVGGESLYELVGRALSRHLERASDLPSRAVPYCTRHTLQTRMGNRDDVKDAVLQRYVGHKPESMTDKHYRQIPAQALLEFAKKVSFGADVEALMAAELGLAVATDHSNTDDEPVSPSMTIKATTTAA